MSSEDIKQLNEKLEFLTAQVMAITARHRPLDELKDDIALFSTDIFNEIINFLADVDYHVNSSDVAYLGKKFLVNVKNLSKALDMLGGVMALLEDVKPLAKDIFNEIIEKLHMLEKHNFFRNIQILLQLPLKWNENFKPEEVANLGEAIIRLTKIGNKLATPENLDKLEKIADAIENTKFDDKRRVSVFSIIRKARSKEVLQGMNYVLDLIKNIAK